MKDMKKKTEDKNNKNNIEPVNKKDRPPQKGKSAGKGEALSDAVKTPSVRFSLRNKFYIIIIPLVGMIIAVMAYFFIKDESSLLHDEIVKFAEREIEHLTNTARLSLVPNGDVLSLLDALKNLKKVPSIKYAYILDTKNKVVQKYDSVKGIDTEEKDTVLNDNITQQAEKYENREKPLLIRFPDPSDRAGMVFDFSSPVMHPLYEKIRLGTVRMGFSDKIIRDAVAKITRTILFAAVFFLVIAIIGSIILAKMTIGPIRKLSQGASMIGSGDLDYKLDIKTSDELGKLAFEFNEMTEHLKKAKEMEVETRVMQEQLDLAKEIQEGLNPMTFYNKNGVEIKGFTRAARGVGGDYFDYIDIDSSRVGALISDVSGKGVPASLVMVMIRTVFVSYISRKDVHCSSVVRAINDSLSADFAIDKFATLFFMIFDRDSDELSFSNAGHGPLFCYRSSLGSCSITKLDGMPIGIAEDVDYTQAKVKLSKGDIVILYTDGITEMRNVEKEDYGLNRLQKLLVKNADLNAEEIVDLVVQSVDAFRGEEPPHDDMTVLVFKRT